MTKPCTHVCITITHLIIKPCAQVCITLTHLIIRKFPPELGNKVSHASFSEVLYWERSISMIQLHTIIT